MRFTVDSLSRAIQIAMVEYDELPKAVSVALERKLILDRWQRAAEKWGRESAARRVLGGLQGQGVRLSRRSLYLWERRYRQRGLKGLMDGRRGNRVGSRSDRACRKYVRACCDAMGGQELALLAMLARALAGAQMKTAGVRIGFAAGIEWNGTDEQFDRVAGGG